MSSWLSNSMIRPIAGSGDSLVVPGSVLVVTINILILYHSFKTHGNPLTIQFNLQVSWKPIISFKMTSTRLKTELAVYATLGCGLMLILAAISKSRCEYVLFRNVMYEFFSIIVQLCDVFMFYDRLRAVVQIPSWKKCTIYSYIWIVLVSSWMSTYTITPFFVDTNSANFMTTYDGLNHVYCWGTFLFNSYMSLECSFVLQKIVRRLSGGGGDGGSGEVAAVGWMIDGEDLTISEPTRAALFNMKSIAIRSIIHAITSSCASFAFRYLPYPFGTGIYSIAIPVGMHVLFNVDWWASTHRQVRPLLIALSRDDREGVARRGRLTTVVRMLRLLNDRTETADHKIFPESDHIPVVVAVPAT